MKLLHKILAASICGLALLGSCIALFPSSAGASSSAFRDVSTDDWYYDSVHACRETGIFIGDNNGLFLPDQKITAQESWAVLARLHKRQVNDDTPLVATTGQTWSEPYLLYCLEKGILSKEEADEYSVLDRERFALFLSRIYDFDTFDVLNPVTSVVDYDTSSDLGKHVLALYRAGILCGMDEYGSFSPLSELSRAECAAVIARLVNPDRRVQTAETAGPLKMNLAFLSALPDTCTIYQFDGKYIYLVDDPDKQEPVYFVMDLYGRQLLESRSRITPQREGIFAIYNDDAYTISHYNAKGALIYEAPAYPDIRFSYGKLAVQQADGTISVIDTQGREDRLESSGEYRIVGEIIGDHIQVSPLHNGNETSSYWLEISTGTLRELPFRYASPYTANGKEHIAVNVYDKETGQYFYNAADLSLNMLFSQPMRSVRVLSDGAVVAEDSDYYYTLSPGEAQMRSYSKEEFGEIFLFSTGDRIQRHTADGKTEISNIRTGEVYAVFPEISTYRTAGRSITRARNADGKTVVDLFDQYGRLQEEGIPVDAQWSGTNGEFLYIKDGNARYISQ